MTEELNDNESQELENNEVNEAPVEETSTEATIEPTADQLVAEWKDKYVRLTADFENFRRQRNLERIELLKNASRDVIVDLLPVLDIFELGMKNIKNYMEQMVL